MLIRSNRFIIIAAAVLLLVSAFVAPTASAFAGLSPEARSDSTNSSSNNNPNEGTLKPVQAFDVSQGKIVKTVANDKKFQKMAKSWIKSVSGLSPQITSDSSCTFVYRVPLDKPTVVTAGAVTVTAQDLFLFYCQDKPPLLLVFDDARKPYLMLFDKDIKPFIRKVGVPELAE
ncbi:hypothetical protein ACX1C1_18810 [Paenibacillus sp. strain BS8-2]